MQAPLHNTIEVLKSLFIYGRMNKLRFLYMLLNMAVGVFSLTTVLIISKVGKKNIFNELQSYGINRLWIFRDINSSMDDPNPDPWTSNRQISNDDISAIKRYCTYIHRTAPSIWHSSTVTYNGQKFDGVLTIGTVSDWQYIKNESLLKGRFLVPVDDIRRNPVCIVSYEAYKSIFGEGEAIGRSLQVKNEFFTVVGILNKKERPIGELINIKPGREETIFIPLGVMQSQSWLNTNNVQYVDLQVTSLDKSQQTKDQIINYLNIQYGTKDRFKVKMLYSQIQIARRIMRTLSIVLGIIASVMLLIAGISIMNIMLAIIAERVFEIGIRRAVGATRKDILFQFIMESIIIGLFGGMIGILGGIGVYYVSQYWLLYTQVPILSSILAASVVSILIGLIAGIYPAHKAASLNPIDALNNS